MSDRAKDLFNGSFFALYSQIGLYDTEDTASYPEWETGLELVVFNKKGVAVSTKGDMYIKTTIYDHPIDTKDMLFYAQGQINVGKKGLTVGNEVAASTAQLDWKEGLISIEIYADRPQNEATAIVFILKHLD
jgi:hypothetical protein